MIRSYLTGLLTLLTSGLSSAQTNYLIPYRDGNKWGYCDTAMHMILPAKYDTADRFFSGYAEVRTGARHQLIDKTGKVLFSGDFSIAYPTIEYPYGTIVILGKDGKYGLGDISDGFMLLPPIFRHIGLFGSAAIVEDDKGIYGLYSVKTRWWILPRHYQQIFFDIDHFIVQNGRHTEYYAVSDNGRITRLPPPPKKKENPSPKPPLRNGPPPQEVIIDETTTTAPVDKSPKVMIKEGKTGMISFEGRVLIPFVYDEIKSTYNSRSDSIYIVKKDGKWGLTQYDKVLLPCVYDEVARYDFNKDGFYLKQGKKQGFYVYSDPKKLYRHVIPCKYDWLDGQLTWVQPADVNRDVRYGSEPKDPFFILGVHYNYTHNGWTHGFVDLNGHEFFKD